MNEAAVGTSSFLWVLLLAAAVIIAVAVAIAVAAGSRKKTTAAEGEGSYFDGSTWQLIGYRILMALVCTVTLGIAYPWMLCMVQRWEVKHTVIHGRRLKFTGHGHQLLGKYLLWTLLTLITFGIYGIWLGLGIKKWVVKHTVYAHDKQPADSYFSGGAGGYLGIHILSFLLTLFTFGIGKAWADCMVLRWEARHTHIGGSPLVFDGTGGQLFVKYLLLGLLTPLTLGIYALFFPVIYLKWQISHTEAVYQTPEIQAKARAHETAAIQNYARYRIAANDQQIAAMKSGYTGKEDEQTLERMAEGNNPFAAFHLAGLLRGEDTRYGGRALELLQKAAEGKCHAAMLDLAKQLPPEQAVRMLTEAAQCGNAEASWLLAVEYRKANDLKQAAYWFKVALEWGVPEAKDREAEYTALVKGIALQLSENRQAPRQSTVWPIVLGVLGAVIVLLAAVCIFILRIPIKVGPREDVMGRPEYIVYVDPVDVDTVQGKAYLLDDANGYTIAYTMDDSVFFDRDRKILYMHFGLKEYEHNVQLWCENGWFTQAIVPGTGITKVSYPYEIPPTSMEVRAKYDGSKGYLINRHRLDVQEGTSAQAEQWLEQKYGTVSPTGEPSADRTDETVPVTQPQDIADSILGKWENFQVYNAIGTGDLCMDLKRWVFRPDGSCEVVLEYCYESPDSTGIYYDGTYWSVGSGNSYPGDYTLSGSELSVTITVWDLDFTEVSTTVYTVEVDGDVLSMYSPASDSTERFTRSGG